MSSDEEGDIAAVHEALVPDDEAILELSPQDSDPTVLPCTPQNGCRLVTPTNPPHVATHDSSADRTSSSLASATPSSPLSCRAAIQVFSETQDSSTPLKLTTRVALETGDSGPIKALLQAELSNSIKVSAEWAHSLYPAVATSEQIKDYLQKSGKYNDLRWTLPRTPSNEEELYAPYCSIVNSILHSFGMGGRRRAVDTHRTQIDHRTDPISMNPTTHRSSPDISVHAYGPSFITPPGGAQVGFPNMATHFDGKLDKQVNNNHLPQMGTYSRQTFAHQPNRFFVRSLIITEHRAQLFHFDRSGAQYTEPFNIHERPDTFVRLVLGLCAVDEQLLGLDASLHWTTGRGGVRSSGTLRTVDADNQAVEHDLILSEPPSHRSSIQGRGTVCWPVMERASGRQLLVKDYWMSEGRIAEFELLKEVKDLKGVGQMVAYEEGRGQTKDFRGDTESLGTMGFHNRKAIRIILEAYGKSIDKFTSDEEFLGALRDSIAAHQRLLSKKILHRDICNTNILIGPSPKKIGYRGILIDLDMAIKAGRFISELCKDFRTGNPIFYSAAILEGLSMDIQDRPAHDYLDDLEMFFWIFVYLMFTRKANGEKAEIKDIQKTIAGWCRVDGPRSAYFVKWAFITKTLSSDAVKRSLDASWHSVSVDLFLNFKDYIHKLCLEKEKLTGSKLESYLDGIVPNRFSQSPFLKDVDKHYSYILGLFDDALEKAVGAARASPTTGGSSQERPQALTFPPIPPLFMLQSQVTRGSKRRTDDAESALDESPTKPGKRLRFPSGDVVPSSSSSAPNNQE